MSRCTSRKQDSTKGERFAFFKSYYRALAEYPIECQEFLWSAIVRYVYAGESPQFDRFEDKMTNLAMRSIWEAILPNIEKSISQMGNDNALSKNETNVKPISNQSETNVKPISNPIEEDIEKEKELELEDRVNKSTRPKFDFYSELLALGVTEQTASDFMKVRKQKKATNTQTAFNKIKAEVSKANADGVTAEECITMAVENSWQGFSYEWYQNRAEHEKSQGKNIFETHGPQQKPKKVIEGREIFNLYK